MSLTKKSDVKTHLSSHCRRGIHLTTRTCRPDTTPTAGEQANQADAVTGYVTEQMLPRLMVAEPVVPPIVSEPDVRRMAAPTISKRVQP